MHVLQGEEDPINDRLVGPVNDRLTAGTGRVYPPFSVLFTRASDSG